MALAFVQSPGAQTADTKLDLVVDPGAMLMRSLSMWDSLGAFGQVGNQAYGYLWPMGPFFWAGHLLDLPGWVTQRLWLALVLVVAFLGCARLLKALGVRHDLAIILGGLAYALSPRILTTVGPISIEAWPSALAPWVLLALVLGSRQGSPRRYALGAALGVAMVGGVNAAATFAVIPLGAVWLLTRTPGPRRRSLMFWWPLFTALACLWWLVPLVVLGRYSPPFLDYIETAELTTYPTTLFDSLRGTSAWIPYLEARWRAGADLITTPVLIQHSTIVLLLGFVGLSRRDNPHRVFAATGLLLGLLMVTFGHSGPAEGWFAPEQRSLLDGVLSPFRNVHKFDPLVRLPLVLGLAHLVDTVLQRWESRKRSDMIAGATRSRWEAAGARVSHLAVVGLAVVAVVGATQPAWTGRLAPGESFTEVPEYWREATAWVAQEDPQAQSLLLPGSEFGAYVWGTTQDEPMQPLATAPWAVRNAIPLAPVGNIRALDALEERLDRGLGSAGLGDYLRRLGVRFLVVRNDLEPSDDVVDPVLVHQTLASTPGVSLARAFGPLVGGEPKIRRNGVEVSVNHGWQDEYAAVEVFEVADTGATAVGATELPVVIGDPGSLLDLSEQGVLDDQPTVMAYEASPALRSAGPLILTDGMRLRDRYFANMHDGSSATMTTSEAGALDDRRDYAVTTDPAWFTRAELEGVEDVIASSSLSDADTLGGSQPGRLPYAALDGDPLTAWVSRTDVSEPASFRIVTDSKVDAGSARITLGEAPRTLSEIRVRTETGVSEAVVVAAGETAEVDLPPGPTTWFQVEDAEQRTDRQLSIAELDIPGVRATRWLVPPTVESEWGSPDAISLSARADLRTGCAQVDESIRCRPGVTDEGEEASGMRRLLTLPTASTYEPRITVAPRPGVAVPRLLQQDQLVTVSSSSRSTSGASVASAVAALDGLAGTTWVSSWVDPAPTLNVGWLTRREVRGIALSLDRTAPARQPQRVTITYPGGSQSVSLDSSGRADLDPVRTRSLSIRIDQATEGGNLDSDGTGSPLGAGISELSIDGVPFARIAVDTEETDFGCGSGPDLVVNDQVFETAVVGATLDLHLGRPVDARVCGAETVGLVTGQNRIELGATDAFRPVDIVLTDPTSAAVPDAASAVALSGSSYTATAGSFVSLRHNANPGWTAVSGGDQALPLTLDGWRQGFELPAGATTLRTSYAPQTAYQTGLVVGGLLLSGCLALYVVWRRRDRSGDAPILRAARAPGAAVVVVVLVSSGLLGSWWGLAVASAALVVLLPVARRRPEAAQAVGLAPLVVVGVWNSFHPWGGTGTWGGDYAFTHLVLLVPIALLASTVVEPTPRQADDGRSTRR